MHATSHISMRTRRIHTADGGCVRGQRPGRGTERRRAIAESAGLR